MSYLREVSIQIALDSKALEECDLHGVYFEGSEDLDAALRLAKKRFREGRLGATVSLKELKQCVREVVEELGAIDECTYSDCIH